jgi:hypothetical protein
MPILRGRLWLALKKLRLRVLLAREICKHKGMLALHFVKRTFAGWPHFCKKVKGTVVLVLI